ncbi:MAG: L,D-transpeptidase [Oscillospiraceae bacterium]|jgi:lipoprotein-anchoring transpeptidase ErfK/SrfK|nr:L,D-transpeptidase [Oscillospiraceae bacterium]
MKTIGTSKFIALTLVLLALLVVSLTPDAAAEPEAFFDTSGFIYVRYNSNRVFRPQPSDKAESYTMIDAGTALRVRPVAGTDYAETYYNGQIGYVKHVNFKTADASELGRLERGEIYVHTQTQLLSSANGGAELATIPANTLLLLHESVAGMYKVDYADEGMTGYVSANDTWAFPTSAVKYYLFADKAHHMLFVCEANADGTRGKTIVRRVPTSFGKYTTPSIPGKYTITSRERWHYFSPSYAPFVIKYIGAKYLHGPLYKDTDEDTLSGKKTNVIGQDVTGGCLRMAYEDALWIYYNCAEGTTLQIVTSSTLK